jgi:hypothetical protein
MAMIVAMIVPVGGVVVAVVMIVWVVRARHGPMSHRIAAGSMRRSADQGLGAAGDGGKPG